jgi:hypothetical protein
MNKPSENKIVTLEEMPTLVKEIHDVLNAKRGIGLDTHFICESRVDGGYVFVPNERIAFKQNKNIMTIWPKKGVPDNGSIIFIQNFGGAMSKYSKNKKGNENKRSIPFDRSDLDKEEFVEYIEKCYKYIRDY